MTSIFQSAINSLYSLEQSISQKIYNALFGADNATVLNTFRTQIVTAMDGLEDLVEHSTVLAATAINDVVSVLTESEHWSTDNFRWMLNVVLPGMAANLKAYAESRANAWAAHEAVNRENADKAEANTRSEGDAHSREQAARGDAQEAAARTAGDDHTREQLAAAISKEASTRAAGDDHSRQQAAAGDALVTEKLTADINTVLKYAQSLPGLVDSRAAAGYDPTLQARANLLTKLLDTAVAHEPLVAGLVSKLVTTIIDLAGLEDPVLRIAAQLVLKQVIDRLGVDTALGAMINDLIGGLLGGGPPKTLTAIMGDIGNRLDSLEHSTAELAPLAPEADQLHEMGTVIFDAALLGYFVASVADPTATADDTTAVFSPILDPLLSPLRSLLGMP